MRVLIAGELPANVSQLMQTASLAHALSKHGAAVVVALRDLSEISLVSWPPDVEFVPAPVCRRVLRWDTAPITYTEILLTSGWYEERVLTGLLQAWGGLFTVARIDVLVLAHAPTALLAAKRASLPCVRLTTGFFAPPPGQHAHAFPLWADATEEDSIRVKKVERRVLETFRTVLLACSHEGKSLSAVLTPERDLFLSWPELDPYAQLRQTPRSSVGNLTWLSDMASGVNWPAGITPCVLVCLQADYPGLARVLEALLNLPLRAVVYVHGWSAAQVRQASQANLSVLATPLAVGALLPTAQALLCHAESGLVALALKERVPVFVLPYSPAQYVYAQAVVANAFGVMQSATEVAQSFEQVFARFLVDERYAQAVRAACARHTDLPADAAQLVVEACFSLAASSVDVE